MAGTDAVAEIARLEARQPDVVRLARLASVAAVVEPPLLRRLRVEVPGPAPSHAGLEADLWFSPLARVATSSLLTLRPEVLEVLRAQLAEPGHQSDRDRARDVVRSAHEQHSDMLRLEERIIWATLVDDIADLGAAWERAMATLQLGSERAAEAVRWFLQARPRLPASALAHPTVQRLAAASALHVDRVVPPELLAATRFPDALDDVAPLSLPTTRVGVRLGEGGLHFVAPDDAEAGVLTLPATRPLVVEVTWGDSSAVVRADPGAVASLSGLADEAELRTLAGARWRLRALDPTASVDDRVSAPVGRTLTLAVFGRIEGIERLEADGLPGVDVRVIHEPENLEARPDIAVAGVLNRGSRNRLRSIVEQLARVSPSCTVAFVDRQSSSKVRDELRRLLGDSLTIVEFAPDTDVFEGLRELVAGLPDTAYRLGIETALGLLPPVAQAILDSPGVVEQPASPDHEHVRTSLGEVLGEQVPAWLNGSDVHPAEPWTSFPVYLDWFAARLTGLGEGVSTRVHFGRLPFEMVNDVQAVLAPEVDVVLVERRRSGSGSFASFEVEAGQVPTLVERLFAPVIAAVEAEAARRPPWPSPALADLAPFAAVLEVSTWERGLDLRLVTRDDQMRAASPAMPADASRRIESLLARGNPDLTMLRDISRRLADTLTPELRYRFEEAIADGGSVLLRAPTDLPWELLEVRQGLDVTFLGCQAAVRVTPSSPTRRSFAWTQTPGTRIGILAPADPRASLINVDALTQLNVEVLPSAGGALLEALFERDTYAVLHLHGPFTADDRGSGIMLDTDRPLNAEHLVALELAHAPLVFLNGRAGADLIGAFLKAGASSVVSTLWNPSDDEAVSFANRFYEHVLSGGVAPDEALRLLRTQYNDPPFGIAALAYRITVPEEEGTLKLGRALSDDRS